MIRYAQWAGWRIVLRLTGQVQAASSSSSPVVGLSPTACGEQNEKVIEELVTSSSTAKSKIELSKSSITNNGTDSETKSEPVSNMKEQKYSIVAAAFASLKDGKESFESRSKPSAFLDDQIASADSVEALLKIAESRLVSRHHALRIVSILANWTTSNRAKLSEFEGNPRFVKLCRLLSKGLPNKDQGQSEDVGACGDLAMVLGVAGDDEAAKLVASISLPQMIKVMSSLAHKRRRSAPLLRSLAFNIGRQTERLDMKQGADLLYAATVLNFPDGPLLEKACSDLCEVIPVNTRSAVVGSVCTSLGMLRYKDLEILDVLSEWAVTRAEECRTQDLAALLLTLAMVNHTPANADQLFETILRHVTAANSSTPSAWLDTVWSLAVLGRTTSEQVSSVLSPEFLAKLTSTQGDGTSISITSKLKLLNINAVAQHILKNYSGPLLRDVNSVLLTRSREKQQLVAAVVDSLTNLLPSATYLRHDVDTGMGFLLDGECLVDAKLNPLPLVDKKLSTAKQPAYKGTRVGVVVWDYHDLCRGVHCEPNGVAHLNARLLESRGYSVLSVPHSEFNPRERLVRRVQYLEQRLKELVQAG